MSNSKVINIKMMKPQWKNSEIINSDILYTVKEIAQILKVNVDYVHKLRKAGILPFIKLGQFKCRRSSLEKFLEEYEGKDITNPEYIRDLKEGNG